MHSSRGDIAICYDNGHIRSQRKERPSPALQPTERRQQTGEREQKRTTRSHSPGPEVRTVQLGQRERGQSEWTMTTASRFKLLGPLEGRQ